MTSEQPKTQTSKVDYNYNKMGADWGFENHTEQSPIDILTTEAIPSEDLSFSLSFKKDTVKDVKLVDEQVTLKASTCISNIEAKLLSGNKLSFESVQFHFHAPSEHTINGKYADLELHIVHKDDGKHDSTNEKRKFAVFGVFFNVDENAKPHPFIDALKVNEGEKPLDINF
mmetsp:Transcript_26390/g.23320  ORF Transcript_26390/g.23320 Transcript_26390/m.23320 type:complete len:171 (+) Transcript_26390:132-644(+)|eukprot:CAMPEP_0114576006 /NCGR_PEP_ID=MMETSP0125-20121206/813_1 /TAXON_ID=485358 ORGANISM="Aristerostoma sp., Strain ATCC 50986" /NCGR_SAMPLE_ID=MMETSP0125 /ASSEMBLY_ACC=CAM_ASM_000245 /LENGTH=170 /DNA_ID=CAMNT_0001764179 /DNA_START=66 /DNA_END=578 /DNA_ORIENTATION=+